VTAGEGDSDDNFDSGNNGDSSAGEGGNTGHHVLGTK
jgi:hypothetical protein